MSEERVIVNGENQILGRMCSMVIRYLKEGKKVAIVNAKKIVISGDKRKVIEGYKLLFEVRTMYNPEKSGIRRPRNPQRIVKRTIRGMLPKNESGKKMLKMVKVYNDIPPYLQSEKMISFPEANNSRLKGYYVYLSEVAKEMGWRHA
ncbi:50S ribosomal protein L13 [Sulfolobales archaeon HS-7]|nr:50S ribosomal protein L13 [Sulfolobales archaeon HS-7]